MLPQFEFGGKQNAKEHFKAFKIRLLHEQLLLCFLLAFRFELAV